MNTTPSLFRVGIRPNPFTTTLTLEVASMQNQQVIVKLSNQEGGIAKLFGWYLLKGTNVTTIKDVSKLPSGTFSLSILNNEGEMLHQTNIEKV